MSAKMRAIFHSIRSAPVYIPERRPNDGTDPTGFFNVEFFVDLFSKGDWTRGISKEEIIKDMQDKLEDSSPAWCLGFQQRSQQCTGSGFGRER